MLPGGLKPGLGPLRGNSLSRLVARVHPQRPSPPFKAPGPRGLGSCVAIGDVAPPVLTSGEPTALAIGRAAGELFAALPEFQRKRLAEVPDLIERLEADVLSLRADAEGSAQHQRLTTAVTALEALRLDLMLLHAGKASLDELTQDVAEARRIGEEIDAEMKGRDAVRQLLADE